MSSVPANWQGTGPLLSSVTYKPLPPLLRPFPSPISIKLATLPSKLGFQAFAIMQTMTTGFMFVT